MGVSVRFALASRSRTVFVEYLENFKAFILYHIVCNDSLFVFQNLLILVDFYICGLKFEWVYLSIFLLDLEFVFWTKSIFFALANTCTIIPLQVGILKDEDRVWSALMEKLKVYISSPEDKTLSYAIFKIVQERQKTDSNIQ